MFNHQGVQVSNKMIIIGLIILLTSTTFTSGDTRIMNFMEGEIIQLNFTFPCKSTEITLQYGYSAPFYDSANPESTSLPENQQLIVHFKTESDKCFIQLLFTPVLRSDEGGYILTSYTDGRTFLEHTKIGLRVDYPPGKASCEWNEEDIAHDWVLLHCAAPAGSLPGEIICHQNGIRGPHLTTHMSPHELDDTLKTDLWVMYSQPAFCCSAAITQHVDRCACNDYKWDPYRNVTHPCPVTMVTTTTPPENSTPSKSHISTPTLEATQTTEENHRSNFLLHMAYSCPLVIFEVIFIGLALRMYYRKPKIYQVVTRQPSQEECKPEL